MVLSTHYSPTKVVSSNNLKCCLFLKGEKRLNSALIVINCVAHVGSGAARRGDVIRCTVMFGSEEERDGKVKVPVVFSVNGSEIILKGDEESRRETKTYIDADKPLYPFIAFKYQNSVLAKVTVTVCLFTFSTPTVFNVPFRTKDDVQF